MFCSPPNGILSKVAYIDVLPCFDQQNGRLIEMRPIAVCLLALCFLAPTLRADVIAGPVTNALTGHIYYLLAQNTWPASQAEARTLGGNLATIDDQAENDWVFSSFGMAGGQPRCLWIGYHRAQLHGPFSWTGGASSTFTNWSLNEPNDHFYGGEPEFFTLMWDPSRTEFFRAPGTWNDVPEITFMDTIPICGVVEIPRVRLAIAREGANIRIGWASETNRQYQLEYRVSLLATNGWNALGGPIVGNGLTNYFLDITPAASEKYYRVREVP
jgi:hypothetical protein